MGRLNLNVKVVVQIIIITLLILHAQVRVQPVFGMMEIQSGFVKDVRMNVQPVLPLYYAPDVKICSF